MSTATQTVKGRKSESGTLVVEPAGAGHGAAGGNGKAVAAAAGKAEPVKPAAAPPSATAVMQLVPLAEIKPSPSNPRKHFDQEKLAQLAENVRQHGVLSPIIVRPNAKLGAKYEVADGERRFRAATLAELKQVPVTVMNLDDGQLLELQLISNLQRDDLEPMEEARGYRALIKSNPTKHSAEAIAEKIGKSPKYIWDRMKLLDLVPEAQKLVERGLIGAAHAVLVARLKPADQKRIIDPENGGLFENEHRLYDPIEDRKLVNRVDVDPYEHVKPRSVREVDAWISDHVRFDPVHAAAAAPLLFEETKTKVDAALARPGKGKKVIPITYSYRVDDDAKDPSGERTYGEQSWERADGQHGSKPCDHSVLGVVAAGPYRGDAFDVCVSRDKCRVHFGDVIRQREAREKAKKTPAGKRDTAREAAQDARWAKEEADRQAAFKKREEEAAQFRRALPAIVESIAAAVKGAAEKVVVEQMLKRCHPGRLAKAKMLLKPGKSAADALRCVLMVSILGESSDYHARTELPKAAGPFGGQIGKILKDAEAAEKKPEPKAPAKAAKKKPSKKGGRK